MVVAVEELHHQTKVYQQQVLVQQVRDFWVVNHSIKDLVLLDLVGVLEVMVMITVVVLVLELVLLVVLVFQIASRGQLQHTQSVVTVQTKMVSSVRVVLIQVMEEMVDILMLPHLVKLVVLEL
tara:strand:- start:15 stop:383 length:369 start_codon:yes stop_codon:yes gene_type:complete